MITYQYRAVSMDGVRTRGVIEAVDEYTAVEKIKATCPIVEKITPISTRTSILSMEIGGNKIDHKALSVMCSQFAIILRSGVTVSKTMEMIAAQTKDKKLRKMLEGAAEDVSEGHTIAKSFERNCSFLPVIFIETIRAGEQSGTIDKSFETLEKYYEKSYKTNQKVKRAMSYPIFVFCIAIIVVAIVMIKVIPTLSQTFKDLGGNMPLMTRMLVSVSDFFAAHWIVMFILLLAVIIGLRFYVNSEDGRHRWDGVKLKLPIFGNIILLNSSSQFANTMSALISAGLSVHQSLNITSKVMDNSVIKDEIYKMSGQIQEGRQLGDCLRKSEILPTTLIEMCAIGENTGELDKTLETVGAYFDNEAVNATEKAISKLEPTILIVMAIFAGFIVLSIYLPMFAMYDLM